jgi:hypothetical protein
MDMHRRWQRWQGYPTTADEILADASYQYEWTSNITHFDYYLKAITTDEARKLGKAPPCYRLYLIENQPESYVGVGIHHGRMIEDIPHPDALALGMRAVLGKPFIKHTSLER